MSINLSKAWNDEGKEVKITVVINGAGLRCWLRNAPEEWTFNGDLDCRNGSYLQTSSDPKAVEVRALLQVAREIRGLITLKPELFGAWQIAREAMREASASFTWDGEIGVEAVEFSPGRISLREIRGYPTENLDLSSELADYVPQLLGWDRVETGRRAIEVLELVPVWDVEEFAALAERLAGLLSEDEELVAEALALIPHAIVRSVGGDQ